MVNIKMYCLFFEGKTEETTYYKWISEIINDEKIKIYPQKHTHATTYQEKNKKEIFSPNINYVINELKKVQKMMKNSNIKGVYVIDNIHLDKYINDYKCQFHKNFIETMYYEYNIIFLSCKKTFDDIIRNFIIDNNISQYNDKELKNKTKVIKLINVTQLNKIQQNKFKVILYSNLKLPNNNNKLLLDEVFN